MDCRNCLNLQTDGLCAVYGKEPPPGFAARCRNREEGPAATEAESTTTRERLCRTKRCPFLVDGVPPGDYCRARILPDRTEYLLLREETPCPRQWTN